MWCGSERKVKGNMVKIIRWNGKILMVQIYIEAHMHCHTSPALYSALLLCISIITTAHMVS